MRVQTELEECEQVNRELRKRIIKLEKDNDDMQRLAMETEERMSSTQSDLERRVGMSLFTMLTRGRRVLSMLGLGSTQ